MAYFNPLRPSYLDDPYPALSRLRSEEPVHYSADFGAWVVTGYDQCVHVLRDYETFSSVRASASLDEPEPTRVWREAVWGDLPTLIDTDPPLHTQLRNYVNHSYTPSAVEPLRPYAEAQVDALLRDAPEGEAFDLMEALAKPLPLHIKMENLGIPEGDRPAVLHDVDILMAAMDPGADPDAVQAAGEARERLLKYHAEAPPPPSVRQGEEDLPEDALISAKVDLTLGGNDDASYAIGNAVLSLLRNPQQLETLREQPERIAEAVEELLRFDGPSHGTIRYAMKDTTLGGQTIASGDGVFVLSAGANRDPSHFHDPDELDLDRSARLHLSFGRGAHYCLGAPLARIELAAAISGLLKRFGEFELAEGETSYSGNFILRGPSRLMVIGRP